MGTALAMTLAELVMVATETMPWIDLTVTAPMTAMGMAEEAAVVTVW